MKLKNKYTTLLLSISLFAVFFSYYFVTSNILPLGAGPDWKSNTDVSEFIYKNGRLAVLPDDEDKLHFTVYGGTRALRPPLSFIVSAVTANVFSSTELEPSILFRKGSALLCALAVALTFYALSLYFLSYRIGILGAVIIGLMPQFTFIASYNNDDSGAILSATLMLAALVRIYRYGLSNSNAALLGFAGGIVIISKMSAWLLLPLVGVFLIIFVRANKKILLRYIGIASVFFILGGGWWLAFNMYNYGIDDPINKKISIISSAEHRRLPLDSGVGFATQNIGFKELLVDNYKNFLGETANSTIGNLDWLKLRVGPMQYSFYLAIFYLAILYYLFRLANFIIISLRRTSLRPPGNKPFLFESILISMMLFQLIMYTWTNIYNDIQIQGKYLIPVFLAVLLLFFSGIHNILNFIRTIEKKLEDSGKSIDSFKVGTNILFLSGLLAAISVHWNAWTNYVIPFYHPPAQEIHMGSYRSVPLGKSLHAKATNLDIKIYPETLADKKMTPGVQYLATGEDPQVMMNDDICNYVSTNSMLILKFTARKEDILQFFIDEGEGFSAKNSVSSKYTQGENRLFLPISSNSCKHFRFDPFTSSDNSLLLQEFQIVPLKIHIKR